MMAVQANFTLMYRFQYFSFRCNNYLGYGFSVHQLLKTNTNDNDQSIIRKELEEFALKSQQEKRRKKELEEKVIKW